MRDFDQSLPMSLLLAREAVMAKFTPILREHGLSSQQWRVLRVLAIEDRIDATEISQRCCLMMPSLSRILRSMEASGYIERLKDQQDQRRALVSLTTEGRSIFDRLAPYNEARYDHIEQLIGRDKLEQLTGLLQETIHKLNESELK